MLPDINLDNEYFDDILDNARNSIASIYPEWTDFNYHDPGMTMLEMFAWLKESQQYYLNKIGPDNISKYLKLLGLKRRTKTPSSTDVSVIFDDDITAARGTKLYAGDICFEADRRTYISSSAIDVYVCDRGGEMNVAAHEQVRFGGDLHMLPFDENGGGAFYIGFDKPLAEKELHTLWLDIASEDGIERNPITDPAGFTPLVSLCMEYYDGLFWRPVKWEDKTYGFLFSGNIMFTLAGKHGSLSVGGHEAYYVRFRVCGGEYDALPVIKRACFNLLPVTQRDTQAEYTDLRPSDELRLDTELAVTGETRVFLKDENGCFTPVRSFEKRIDGQSGEVILNIPGGRVSKGVRVVNMTAAFSAEGAVGYGTGLPFQEYDLETKDVEYETFAIMTELPGSGGKYAECRKVNDFAAAGTDDFVYVLDTQKGRVTFGDCIHGMAPEGEILIIACSLTRGAQGNVTKGKINEIKGFDRSQITVENQRASYGGTDEETMEECTLRAQRLLKTTDTIVTDEDCERFVSSTQGLRIEKCKVIKSDSRRDGFVTPIVVKPYAKNGMGIPSEEYVKNILDTLEPHRMLGAQFWIVRPEYAQVMVYADITAARNTHDLRQRVINAIASFFEEIKDDFGARIVYSRLYELIDSVDGVFSINVLTMQTEGSNAERTGEGDLLLMKNAAAYLTDIDVMINT